MAKRSWLLGGDFESPAELLGLLHRVVAIAVVLVLSISAWGIHHTYETYVLKRAGDDAISIAQLITRQPQYLIYDANSDLSWVSALDAQASQELDEMVRQFLIPFDILKIKMFAPDGTIVYSSQFSDVGKLSKDNARLANALAGNTDIKTQTKDEIHDLQLKARRQVDVVETYVPVYNNRQQIVGSFEIYKDMSLYRQEIKTGVLTSTAVLATIFVVVFSIAYIVVRLAVNRLASAQQELHRIATHDALTEIFNRREIMLRAEQEFVRFQRQVESNSDANLSVIMADVDYFKRINDKFGHQIGDQTLQGIASVMTAKLRKYNHIGRYGGEEFLILLSDTDAEEAVRVAQRLRQAVKSVRFSADDVEHCVTLSMGVATAAKGDQSFDQVLTRADRALYQAKNGGRDRVIAEPWLAPAVG